MKTILSCVIVLALVVTVLVEHAAAVGPGGRGRGGAMGRAAAGPRPGGPAVAPRPATAGNNRPAVAPRAGGQGLPQRAAPAGPRTAASRAAQRGPRPKPFSPAWYAHHPQAWHYTHPHAGVAVAVSAVAVARWLAVPAIGYGEPMSTVVLNETPADELYAEAPPAKPMESVGMETEPIDAPTKPEVGDSSQWMDLGSFAVNPPGQTQTTHLVQLAVAHDGTIRGTYFDVISDHTQDVVGNVDKASLRVFWSVGSESGISFEAPLEVLSQQSGDVTVHFPNDTTAVWKMTRLP